MPRWDLLCAEMGSSTSCCSSSGDFVCLWLSVPPPLHSLVFLQEFGFHRASACAPQPCRAAGSRPASRNPPYPSRSTHCCLFPPFVQLGRQIHRQERLWGTGGGQQEAHTDPPAVVPGCCRLCPCPLEPFCAPQAGQIGSACSQEGWHGTRGELQDVPLRGANGAGKRQGSGAVAVPRWQPLGLEVWVAQSGWGLSEAS